MQLKVTVALAVLLASASLSGQAQTPPSLDSQVVFLYYKDLAPAAAFYGETLGLEKTFDRGWVQIYRSSQNSYVGLVDETRGRHRDAADKPVMLSLVTKEIDAWYAYLKERKVKILSPISDSSNVPVRVFLTEDPGGYTVEFFQWRESEAQ